MTKQDIIRKLTSRKFWLAIAAFVTEMIVAFHGDAEIAETVSCCIMAGATVIAYIIGEGLTDAAKLSGYFSNGATTADYRTDTNDRYASAAKAMISAGIVPSDEQLEAMDWTPEQYWIYKMAQNSAT